MEAAHEEVAHQQKHHKHHHTDAAHFEVELPPDKPEVDEISFWHDFIAGGVAGMASVVVGHPFDTVKVGPVLLLGRGRGRVLFCVLANVMAHQCQVLSAVVHFCLTVNLTSFHLADLFPCVFGCLFV
jgi:hypothetical protein